MARGEEIETKKAANFEIGNDRRYYYGNFEEAKEKLAKAHKQAEVNKEKRLKTADKEYQQKKREIENQMKKNGYEKKDGQQKSMPSLSIFSRLGNKVKSSYIAAPNMGGDNKYANLTK